MGSYIAPDYQQPPSGTRSRRGSSNASKYIPENYLPPPPPRVSNDGFLVPPSGGPPYPAQGQAAPGPLPAMYAPPHTQLQPHGSAPYPVIDDYRPIDHRRHSSSSQRPDDSRRYSHSSAHSHRSGRSHRSHHSTHSHRSRNHDYDLERPHHHRDREHSRSRRNSDDGDSRRYSTGDEVRPLRREKTLRPTLGGTVYSMFNAIKDALGPRDKY